MTRAILSEKVRGKHGSLSKREAKRAVKTVFESIRGSLQNGENVQIKGFGGFHVRTFFVSLPQKPGFGKQPS